MKRIKIYNSRLLQKVYTLPVLRCFLEPKM